MSFLGLSARFEVISHISIYVFLSFVLAVEIVPKDILYVSFDIFNSFIAKPWSPIDSPTVYVMYIVLFPTSMESILKG